MAIRCRDFERLCNELLDLGSLSAPDKERVLLDHAAGCSACRAVASRYQALRQALSAWVGPPAAPAGLAERILAAARAQSPPVPRRRGVTSRTQRFWRTGLPLATVAASVAALVTVGLLIPKLTIDQPGRTHRAPRVPERSSVEQGVGAHPILSDARALDEAVAGATAATWELARSASEPAARFGREVLDAATEPDRIRPDSSLGADSVAVLSFASLAPDSGTAAATLQQVGDRLASGVGPLSTTARHAFGFLLGPAVLKPEVRVKPPAAKGA